MNTVKNVAEKIATKPAQSNGQETKPTNAAVKIPTIEPEKRESVTTKKSLPTLEEKLNVLGELNSLVQKRDLVREALKDVSKFYISPSGNCQVKMTDSNGKSFTISHPAVIEEILSHVTFKLEEELDKVETQFEWLF